MMTPGSYKITAVAACSLLEGFYNVIRKILENPGYGQGMDKGVPWVKALKAWELNDC